MNSLSKLPFIGSLTQRISHVGNSIWRCLVLLALLWTLSVQSNQGFGQQELDELWSQWEDESLPDTTRLKAVGAYARSSGLLRSNPDSAYQLAEAMLQMAETGGHQEHKAIALKLKGNSLNAKGNIFGSLEALEEAKSIFEELDLGSSVGAVLANMGGDYRHLGDYDRAIELYDQALKYMLADGREKQIGQIYNGIGVIYMGPLGDYEKAQEHFEMALKFVEQSGSKKGAAAQHCNLALAGAYQKNSDFVEEHARAALGLYREHGDSLGVMRALASIAILNQNLGNYNNALIYLKRILATSEQMNLPTVSNALLQISSTYEEMKDYTMAIEYGLKGLEHAKETHDMSLMLGTYQTLYKSYSKLNRYQEALEMHEQFTLFNDSVSNQENRTALIHQEYRFEYQKKAIADSVRNVEKQKVQDAQLAEQTALAEKRKVEAKNKQLALDKKQKEQNYLFGGLALLVVFLIIVTNRFMVTRKQNKIIQSQKKLVEEAAKTKLENERLKAERLTKDLTNATLEISRKQEWIEEVRTQLKRRSKTGEEDPVVKAVLLDISQQIQLEEKNELLYAQVDEVNTAFREGLKKRHAKLTQGDLELCSMLRLNMSSKDIAKMKNITEGSVITARKRLRKKLELEKGEDLISYIKSF